jgi:D-glycero-D-manno-heptose 1,7-bisphosphate phosphatase
MSIKLVIFDLNNTLANTPFIDKQPLALLPGRLEKCQELREQGITLAIASNQGGVAFGFTIEAIATQEVADIAKQIGAEHFMVAFGHPKPKRGFERYGSPEMLSLRKPEPGMLINLMRVCGASPDETIMVGDREEDSLAAGAAGVKFVLAELFFGD